MLISATLKGCVSVYGNANELANGAGKTASFRGNVRMVRENLRCQSDHRSKEPHTRLSVRIQEGRCAALPQKKKRLSQYT